MRILLRFSVLLIFFFLSDFAYSQGIIKGVLNAGDTGAGIENAEYRLIALPSRELISNGFTTTSGGFRFENIKEGKYLLELFTTEYGLYTKELDFDGKINDLNFISLSKSNENATEEINDIPTINLNDQQLSDDGRNAQDVSGLLTASRDVFVAPASFNFANVRFRFRGLPFEYNNVYLNGILVNDLEDGTANFSEWGGLNDVFRNREFAIALAPSSYSFGDFSGATYLDSRASKQRKSSRLSYGLANRTYSHRIMATYSSGLRNDGWAFSVSGSRRWAQEGYVPGTFYDAWAYFLGIDKRFNDKHTLSLTAFGAPIERGTNSPAVKEMFELSGDNYYNPNWGVQDNGKRNARVNHVHQPMVILKHMYNINNNSWLSASASFQFGASGRTGLDWIDAPDPRPDYYSKLPSNANESIRPILTDLFKNNESTRQLSWNNLYQVNYNQPVTTFNNSNATVTGKRAQYLLQDARADATDLNFYLNGESRLNDHIVVNGGLQYRQSITHNYLKIMDLLGADYHVNVDKFAEQAMPGDPNFAQADLDNPNAIVKVGDNYGYDYNSHLNNAEAWAQIKFNLSKFDFYGGGKVAHTTMFREGLNKVGRFPTLSKGNSEKYNALTYDAKLGATYKINGRNYIDANIQTGTRAPLFRNTFIAPRVRNQLASTTPLIDINGGELSYVLRTPKVKAKITGYYLSLANQTRQMNFFDEQDIFLADDTLSGGFVNYFLSGIDQVHQGIEFGLEVKLSSALRLNAAANYGEYRYTSRFKGQIYEDNALEPTHPETIYSNNYYVANGPQKAYTVGFNYTAKDFWFLNLNFNYVDQMWVDFNATRRTETAIKRTGNELSLLEEGNGLYHQILDQEKLPGAFTVDLFFGKSFKLKTGSFIRINLGVNNILDNQFISNGFEQLRYDYDVKNVDKFATKYNYAFGRNFLLNIVYDLDIR